MGKNIIVSHMGGKPKGSFGVGGWIGKKGM